MESLSVVMGLPEESVAVMSLALPPTGLALEVSRTLLVSLAWTLPDEVEEPKALAGIVSFTPAVVSSKVPPEAGVMDVDLGGFNDTVPERAISLPVTEPALTSMAEA